MNFRALALAALCFGTTQALADESINDQFRHAADVFIGKVVPTGEYRFNGQDLIPQIEGTWSTFYTYQRAQDTPIDNANDCQYNSSRIVRRSDNSFVLRDTKGATNGTKELETTFTAISGLTFGYSASESEAITFDKPDSGEYSDYSHMALLRKANGTAMLIHPSPDVLVIYWLSNDEEPRILGRCK